MRSATSKDKCKTPMPNVAAPPPCHVAAGWQATAVHACVRAQPGLVRCRPLLTCTYTHQGPQRTLVARVQAQ